MSRARETRSAERVRAWLALRLCASSYRTLARQIGLRHQTVANFLAGGAPRAQTWARLTTWYARDRERARRVPPERDPAETAVLFLAFVQAIPSHMRVGAIRRLARLAAREYERCSARVPAWVISLERLAGGAGAQRA